jgi:hypothetical protein
MPLGELAASGARTGRDAAKKSLPIGYFRRFKTAARVLILSRPAAVAGRSVAWAKPYKALGEWGVDAGENALGRRYCLCGFFYSDFCRNRILAGLDRASLWR